LIVPDVHRSTAIVTGPQRDSSDRPARHDAWLEDELDLTWYVRAVQRRWLLLFAGALISAILGLALATSQPILYEGVTTLLVVPPPKPTGAQINPATFRAMVENASLVSQVVNELGLKSPPHNLTPNTFLERALRVEELRGTNIVKVRVRLTDPAVAAEASKRLAQKAIVLTQQMKQHEGASVQEQLKSRLDEVAVRVRKAEDDLLLYRQHAQVELWQRDTDAMLNERQGLLRLLTTIEAEKARLSAAEQEIKQQNPVLSMGRSVTAEEVLRRSQPAAGSADPERLDLTNGFVNPVYQTLDFQIATSRANLAALEKQRQQLVEVNQVGKSELTKLTELYRRQIEQARLQANVDLATRIYRDLAVKYEDSRTEALGNSAQLQLVDEAVPSDRPLSRRRAQFSALGFTAGLLGAGLVALLWEGRNQPVKGTA
jgi:uncharacterized protein involved in exopolysaccharide biosynthesis